jgi:malate dehydrogenase (oxaloacetate-decarboxylating)
VQCEDGGVTATTPGQTPAPVVRGPVTSASYSITVRLSADGDPASVGRIATAVGSAGGAVTAIDVVESRPDGLTVDVTCPAADAAHCVFDPAVSTVVAAAVEHSARAEPGATVHLPAETPS